MATDLQAIVTLFHYYSTMCIIRHFEDQLACLDLTGINEYAELWYLGKESNGNSPTVFVS